MQWHPLRGASSPVTPLKFYLDGVAEIALQVKLSLLALRCSINDSRRRYKQLFLFPRRMAACSCGMWRVWIGPRSAHLPPVANRQRSQTDCWQSDSRSGQTFGGEF